MADNQICTQILLIWMITVFVIWICCSSYWHKVDFHTPSLDWPWDLLWPNNMADMILYDFWGWALQRLHFGSHRGLPWDHHTRKLILHPRGKTSCGGESRHPRWRPAPWPGIQVSGPTSPADAPAECIYINELRHSQQRKHPAHPQEHEKP